MRGEEQMDHASIHVKLCQSESEENPAPQPVASALQTGSALLRPRDQQHFIQTELQTQHFVGKIGFCVG